MCAISASSCNARIIRPLRSTPFLLRPAHDRFNRYSASWVWEHIQLKDDHRLADDFEFEEDLEIWKRILEYYRRPLKKASNNVDCRSPCVSYRHWALYGTLSSAPFSALCSLFSLHRVDAAFCKFRPTYLYTFATTVHVMRLANSISTRRDWRYQYQLRWKK